jgi:hypothetical protein
MSVRWFHPTNRKEVAPCDIDSATGPISIDFLTLAKIYFFHRFGQLYHCTESKTDAGLVAWWGSQRLSSQTSFDFCFSYPEFSQSLCEGGLKAEDAFKAAVGRHRD